MKIKLIKKGLNSWDNEEFKLSVEMEVDTEGKVVFNVRSNGWKHGSDPDLNKALIEAAQNL